MRFLLSIHDVWPGNFPLVADYLQRLRSLGNVQTALLVVPNYHGQSPMDQNEEFLAWLRGESTLGTEIFLHGYRHWMPELAEGGDFKGQRSAWGRWMNKHWVQQEAEFCGLSDREKNRLLKMGLAAFQQTDIPCAGFVAPTWHGRPGRSVLRAQEINILETRFFINHLETRQQRFAPPLAWGLAERGQAKLIGGAWWLHLLLKQPLIKVAIHPGDMDVTETLRILEKVFATGKSSSYRELFEKGIQGGPILGIQSGPIMRPRN